MSNNCNSINKTEETDMSHMGHFYWCLVKIKKKRNTALSGKLGSYFVTMVERKLIQFGKSKSNGTL